ncbi:lipoprotein [Streptomyces sp. NPDC003327]
MSERPLPIRRALPVAGLLAAGLLTAACGTTPKPEVPASGKPTTVPPAATATASTAPAPVAAGTLGGRETVCALPVSFTLTAGWEPEVVRDTDNPDFAALTRQGPATVRCEVDAKPAGHVGFLRVWTAPKNAGTARAALEGFVKAEEKTSGVTYRETKAGALPATEVTYTVHNEALGETKEERAFAVEAPKGTVIVHLGGMDTAEHRAMLPAYELARSTVKPL